MFAIWDLGFGICATPVLLVPRLLEPLESKIVKRKRKRKKQNAENEAPSAVLSRKRGPAPLLALLARCFSLPAALLLCVRCLGLQYAQDLPTLKICTHSGKRALRHHLPGDRTATQGQPWLSSAHDGQAPCREAHCAMTHAQEATNQQEAVSPAAGLCQGHPVDRPAWLPCVLGWLQGHSLCWTYYSAKVEGRPDLLEHEGIRTLR